jgi:hypothetical protein
MTVGGARSSGKDGHCEPMAVAATARMADAAARLVARARVGAGAVLAPEAPEGWRWWQQMPRSRRQRWGLGLLIGVPAVIVSALMAFVVVAEVVSSAKGCGSVDPTDPANYSRITIVNDQSSDVIVNNCQGSYCTLTQPVRLGPGQRYAGDAACGASGTDMTSWQVNTASGMVLGYIAVDSPRSNDSLIFRVSQVSHSRRTPTRTG